MNLSESTSKLSPYLRPSSGTGNDVESSEITNQPPVPLPEDVNDESNPDVENELSVYDLEEFKEAKKDWIKTFFYSKKNGLKKLIGLKENDNSENKELNDSEGTTNDILVSDNEAEIKNKAAFYSGLENTAEQLQKNKESYAENYKRIRTDVKKLKAVTREEINLFLTAVKSENKEYNGRKKLDLKIFSEKHKHLPIATASDKKTQIKVFFKDFKQETRIYFKLKKEDVQEYFYKKAAGAERFIAVKKADLNNADSFLKSKESTKKFIKVEQKKIKNFIIKKEKLARKEIKKAKQVLDERSNSQKISVAKNIKRDKNAAELQALLESNRQVIKDLTSPPNDTRQYVSRKPENENVSELYDLIESNKQVMKDFIATQKHKLQSKSGLHINQKADELKILIESNKQVMQDFIALQKDIRRNESSKMANQPADELKVLIEFNKQMLNEFIASQKRYVQTESINPVNQTAYDLQTLIESNKQEIKNFIASQKDILQNELLNLNNRKEVELHSFIESCKQEIKDIIPSQKEALLNKQIQPGHTKTAEDYTQAKTEKEEIKDSVSTKNDILQSFTDTNKIADPPRSFRDIDEINKSIAGKSVYSAPLTVPEPPQSDLKRSLKILVAEDDILLRKSLSFYLSHNGFDIVQVTNGLEAMEEIHKTHFDVIILDLQMPHMGGLEIIDRVRNQLRLDTKIIVLTASGVEEVELKSFSLGATDFISKPFSPSVVKARIEKIMAGDAQRI